MGLFKRAKRHADRAACTHEELDPRWNTMADVGKRERIDHHVCRACGVVVQADRAAGPVPPRDEPNAA